MHYLRSVDNVNKVTRLRNNLNDENQANEGGACLDYDVHVFFCSSFFSLISI
jgi:hypothetical protein